MEPERVRKVVTAAKDALHNVPVGTENHTVAAACLAKTGQVFTGVNVYHFTGGPCAEPVALATAAAGAVLPEDIELMVAVKRKPGSTDEITVINPCGRCRQQMLDLTPDVKVVVIDEDQSLVVVEIKHLLPYSYIWNGRKRMEIAEG